MSQSDRPVLEVSDLSKSYGVVRALSNVNLEIRAGEVLGLLGDNGAGKTTLVKCLSGITRPDSGVISVDGREVAFASPDDARRIGIEAVHQNLALVDALDVTANLFLNRELRKPARLSWVGWMDKRAMHREAEEILARLQIRIPSVRHQIERLSGGQRQAVAVGRAAAWGQHIVLMDEPAAALGVQQAHHVLELVDRLSTEGVAVLFISHNMQQVLEICDRAIVLRHGQVVGDVAIETVTATDLVGLITGATSNLDLRGVRAPPQSGSGRAVDAPLP
jgi:simple sugar transport system ATP-binding protein